MYKYELVSDKQSNYLPYLLIIDLNVIHLHWLNQPDLIWSSLSAMKKFAIDEHV